MTRAERRTRQRTRETAAAGLVRHSMMRATPEMTDNPNRGKHGAARLDITGERDARTIRAARKDYRPLTVKSVIDYDRTGRKRPAFVTNGYTI